jgi:hypothetical protein
MALDGSSAGAHCALARALRVASIGVRAAGIPSPQPSFVQRVPFAYRDHCDGRQRAGPLGSEILGARHADSSGDGRAFLPHHRSAASPGRAGLAGSLRRRSRIQLGRDRALRRRAGVEGKGRSMAERPPARCLARRNQGLAHPPEAADGRAQGCTHQGLGRRGSEAGLQRRGAGVARGAGKCRGVAAGRGEFTATMEHACAPARSRASPAAGCVDRAAGLSPRDRAVSP